MAFVSFCGVCGTFGGTGGCGNSDDSDDSYDSDDSDDSWTLNFRFRAMAGGRADWKIALITLEEVGVDVGIDGLCIGTEVVDFVSVWTK